MALRRYNQSAADGLTATIRKSIGRHGKGGSNGSRAVPGNFVIEPGLGELVDDEHEHELNCSQIQYALELVESIPFVPICIDVIYQNVVENGVQFLDGSTVLELSPEFEQVVQEHYYGFIRDFIKTAAVLGIVPTVSVNKYMGDVIVDVPTVPELGSYFITVVLTSSHQLDYRFYWRNLRDEPSMPDYFYDPDVRIVRNTGWGKPDLQGRLHSPMARIVRYYREWQQHVERSARIGNNLASNPPMVIQRRAERNSVNSKQVKTTSYIDEWGAVSRERDGVQIDESTNYRLAREARRHDKAVVGDVQLEESIEYNLKASAHNVIPMMDGMELANRAMPTQFLKYEEERAHFEELVCLTFGVPPDRIMQPRVRVSGNESAHNETYKAKIRQLKKILSNELTILYRAKNLSSDTVWHTFHALIYSGRKFKGQRRVGGGSEKRSRQTDTKKRSRDESDEDAQILDHDNGGGGDDSRPAPKRQRKKKGGSREERIEERQGTSFLLDGRRTDNVIKDHELGESNYFEVTESTRHDSLTSEEEAEIRRRANITIIFPETVADTTALTFMWAAGMMDDVAYKKNFMRSQGLSTKLADEKKLPFGKEDRKAILLGSQVVQSIKDLTASKPQAPKKPGAEQKAKTASTASAAKKQAQTSKKSADNK